MERVLEDNVHGIIRPALAGAVAARFDHEGAAECEALLAEAAAPCIPMHSYV
jgi:hypothetical protein